MHVGDSPTDAATCWVFAYDSPALATLMTVEPCPNRPSTLQPRPPPDATLYPHPLTLKPSTLDLDIPVPWPASPSFSTLRLCAPAPRFLDTLKTQNPKPYTIATAGPV